MNKFIVANAQECIGCHVCEISCAVAHNEQQWPTSKDDYHPRIWVHPAGDKFVTMTCRHCQDAPCVRGCLVGALTHKDGMVSLDESKCTGCKQCQIACPFGAINMVEEPRGVAQKCDLCASTEAGTPQCVANCPSQALKMVDAGDLQQLREQRQLASAMPRDWKADAPSLNRDALLDKPQRKGAEKIAAEERKHHFEEIYFPLSEDALEYEANRCITCSSKANCNWTCPLHNEIPQWIELARQGKVIEAAELCHQTSSLPEICGRICPQDRLCEGSCTMLPFSGSVTIGNIERYITDTALAQGWRPSVENVTPRKERVAVIGAGPAGLGCADILARQGVQVDVYDQHPEIGGLLTFGIPSFKLDKTVLATRREIFTQMGINFHLDCEIGKDIQFDELVKNYDSIFLGVGTYKYIGARLENEDAKGVIQALPFLIANTREVMGLPESEKYPWVDVEGKNVVVLGGGDTAMDCLRTSIRRNAKSVTCAYRRDEANMPGSKKEVTNAKEEGVTLQFNVQPQFIEVNDQGEVTGVGMIRTKMGEAGADGRRRPVAIEGSEFVLPADVLILAFGFHSHAMPWLEGHNVKLDKWGGIMTNAGTALSTQTSNPKIFAGGDAVHGADLVVTAMVAGRQAAREMVEMFDKKMESELEATTTH